MVVLIQLGRDRGLQIEAFPEHERRRHWSAARRLRIIHERNSTSRISSGVVITSIALRSGRISRARESTSASSISMKN